MTKLYDVIEVGMEKPHPVRIIDQSKSLKNADAIIAIMPIRLTPTHTHASIPLLTGDPAL